MSDWRNRLFGAAGAAEARLDALKRRLDARWGDEPLHISAYDGFGTQARVALSGRVIEDAGVRAPGEADSIWRNLANMYRRFESDEIPGARVLARFDELEQLVQADDEGFFTAEFALPHPPPADRLWHPVELTLAEPQLGAGRPVRAQGRVLVPPPQARFGIISDIDDTVIRTGATSVRAMIRSTLLGNARTRLPFPGVAALYRALHAEANPLFYVSSSPWNIYDMLADAFALRGIPAGPLLLRDWGLAGRLELAFGHHGHKLAAITRVLGTYPALPFLLIGDSGQEDPEIYSDVVRRYPGRILAVYIRNVTNTIGRRTAAIAALAEQVNAAGSALILADDTLIAARHAHARGWISPDELGAVAAAVAGELAQNP